MKYLSSTNCCEKSTKSCQGEKEHLFFYLNDGDCVGDGGCGNGCFGDGDRKKIGNDDNLFYSITFNNMVALVMVTVKMMMICFIFTGITEQSAAVEERLSQHILSKNMTICSNRIRWSW